MSLAMASLLGKTSTRRSSDSQRSLTAVPSNPSLSRSTWPANRLPKLGIMMGALRVECRAHYARAATRRLRQVTEGGALHPLLDHSAHVGAESQSMEPGRRGPLPLRETGGYDALREDLRRLPYRPLSAPP